MDEQLLHVLESKVEALLAKYSDLERRNATLLAENLKLRQDKEAARRRIAEVLMKIEEMQSS